jgi:hypothetical protein
MSATIPHGRFLVSLLLLALMLPLGTAMAQTPEDEPQPGKARPHLAGHSFVENNLVTSPFVRTFVSNTLGLGKIHNLDIPVQDIDGEPVTGLTGDLMLAILSLEYQYAIREWIALRVSFNMVGRLGTDVGALLSEGVTMTSGFELGWLVRLREGEKTSLGLDLAISNRSFTGINISKFIDDILADQPASLVSKAPSMRGYGGIRYAWAASSLVGVTANGILGYGESLDRTQSSQTFGRLGAAVDFDIAGATSLPLGAVLGYSFDTFPEFTNDVSDGLHTGLIRISYMGREDFLLSLDFGWEVFSSNAETKDVKGSTLGFEMRYYF